MFSEGYSIIREQKLEETFAYVDNITLSEMR